MPRSSGRSSSMSSHNSNTSRSGTHAAKPPQQQNQVAKPSMAGGLMGSLMTGMAFGAGAEIMRGLFRNPTTGSLMMPLILSGLGTWGVRKFLLKPGPYLNIYTAGVFGASFILLKGLNSGNNSHE